MFYQSLNQESLRRINNIVTGFKNHPTYASYTIRSYCYDARAGVHAEKAHSSSIFGYSIPALTEKSTQSPYMAPISKVILMPSAVQ